jgi:hypothetical protein
MDPLSITLACIALIGTITKVSSAVTTFARDCTDVPSELDAVTLELRSVKLVLEDLARNTLGPDKSTLPSNLEQQIIEIVKNCGRVIIDIENCLKKHRKSREGFQAPGDSVAKMVLPVINRVLRHTSLHLDSLYKPCP